MISFSEYRAELMGIAIISVLIGHTINFGNITINNTFIKFLNIIPRLAFIQGFLFYQVLDYVILSLRIIISNNFILNESKDY